MKKALILLLASLGLSAQAAPTSQMGNFQISQHSSHEMQAMWNSMRTDVDGDDCYRRAHIWAYDLNREFNANSAKVFLHYSRKWALQLAKADAVRGIHPVLRRASRERNYWGYHVAPMVKVDGKDMVLDRHLSLPYNIQFPYTYEEAYTFQKKPATVEEWAEALSIKGELLWKVRKAELEKEMADLQEDIDRARSRSRDRSRRRSRSRIERKIEELQEVRAQYISNGMDQADEIDIKCRIVNSIAEADRAGEEEWCFVSYAPMYYYNELDLRYLAYGHTGWRYHVAPPQSIHTPENYSAGAAYVQNAWNPDEIIDAMKELKINQEERKELREFYGIED